jgi:hypothetical protein
MEKKEHFWKYSEGDTLRDIQDYLISTYSGHYTSNDSKIQTIDLIDAIGDVKSFTRSNAIKYLSRFGKKERTTPKSDLLKAIHYCILLYHFSGCNVKENIISE